jgi:hypothetical protein
MNIGDYRSVVGTMFDVIGYSTLYFGAAGSLTLAESAVVISSGALMGAAFMPLIIGATIGGGLVHIGNKKRK